MQHVNAVDQKDDVIARYSKFNEEKCNDWLLLQPLQLTINWELYRS